MYYPKSIAAIRDHLWWHHSQRTHDAHGEQHVLWMAEQIEACTDTSIKAAAKMGRWIGFMFCEMERLGFWDNKRSRELAQGDVAYVE